MSTCHSLETGNRHFMTLMDGFPIPKQKTGVLQQILGYQIPKFEPSKSENHSAEGSIDSGNQKCDSSISLTSSFGSILNDEKKNDITPMPFFTSFTMTPATMDEIMIEPYVFIEFYRIFRLFLQKKSLFV